jgi:WD40 repeat protein
MCGSFLTIRDDQIYLIHQSAKDYLSDKERAGIFPSKSKVHYYIFSQSLKLMSLTLKRDMYGLTALGFPIDEVQVPADDPLATTRYSCIYWVDHLCDWSSDSSENHGDTLQKGGAVDIFLRTKYLYLLEALGLCKSISKGIVSMEKLEALVKGNTNAVGLAELVQDAHRCIMYHKRAIESSPLQAYASALLFSPTRSLVRRLFQHEEPKWISVKRAMGDSWSACLQTLEGHSNYVNSVAFSHDSTRLASASDDRTVKIWDASSGACLQTLKGHSDGISSVAFSRDSTRLASASYDRTVKIWDASSGACLQTLNTGRSLSSISFDSTGSCLYTDIGPIVIGASPNSSGTEPQPSQYQGGAVGLDGAWITYDSEKLLWLPSEYRPYCSAVSGKTIGIGVGSGKVWICSFEPNGSKKVFVYL